MTWSFVAFIIFTMACALSPNWTSLLLFRLLTGINASSPIAVIGGVFADIYSDPVARGRAMAAFIGVRLSPFVPRLCKQTASNVNRERVSVLSSHP